MKQTERLSFAKKNANNKAWYKEKADFYDTINTRTFNFKSMKVNYDLYNNKVDIKDFEYVCNPIGSEVGELPAKMSNRDIVSGKIKAVLGMELKRPFSYKLIDVNPLATTQREKEEINLHKQYIMGQIMMPIQEQVLMEKEQELQGRELTEEETAQIQQEIQQSIEQRTPEELKLYMKREYQTPAEILGNQLLRYLKQKLKIKTEFDKAFKHLLLSGKGVIYVGVLNGEPILSTVNSLYFDCGLLGDTDTIEDCEWAVCKYNMTPSQIVKYFNKDLTQKDLDKIYAELNEYEYASEDIFNILDVEESENDGLNIPVIHCVWKSLRKIGFLTYMTEDGEINETIVDESYSFNEDAGDLALSWEWIPEVYETWKIKTTEPIYVNMQPLPGQFKDVDNIYESKLPYYGVVCDNMNSSSTSLMDRLKFYQYYYNIIMYRLELLLASDKGKKLLMNISSIPENMNFKEWNYYLEALSTIYFDNKEEGKDYQDANNVAKTIDLSLMSDIQKYIELAEYIRVQAGKSVGITEQVEGQIGQYESVRNVNSTLNQTSYILEPYFALFEIIKTNVLQALLEAAKVAYGTSQPRKLVYILDDLSKEIINVDPMILDNSTLGLFVSNSYKTNDVIETIKQLSHAALQNQQANLADVIKILKLESIPEIEEVLEVAQDRIRQEQLELQQQQQQHEKEVLQMEQQMAVEKFEREKELTIVREEERRKTEIAKMAIMGASYNVNADNNNNNKNDFIELIDENGNLNPDALTVPENVVNDDKNNNSNALNKAMKNIVKQ